MLKYFYQFSGNVMTYAFAALTLLTAALCIFFRLKDKAFWGMVMKLVAAFSFTATAVSAHFFSGGNELYFLFLMLGLLSGLFGDVFLGVKEIAPDYRKKLIMLGLVFFLSGHLFYLIAFIGVTGFNYVPLLVAAGFAVLAAIGVFAMKLTTSPALKSVLVLYYFFITYMSASAGYMVYITRSTGAILAFCGSMLFVVSDTVISQIYFTETARKRQLGVVETSTYFTAQTFIALSLLFL
jgi:YhhN-like protein.